MVLYGGWDDSGGTDRPPVRPIPIPHLPGRVCIVVHVHGSHAAHLRALRLPVESALVGLALVRPCVSRRFLSCRSPHAGRLCALGVPLRHARLLGRALSDGEPERSQQAPLLSDQHRADADLGTAGPPRVHRLRRPRCFRLFGSSRLHRLQGLAPLPVRALGPRAGDHLAWNLLPASPSPDRGSDRRTPAGGYSGVHAKAGITGWYEVPASPRRKKHAVPAMDLGSALRTRWQPVADWIRRLGRAEGGRWRRDHEMGPDLRTKRS